MKFRTVLAIRIEVLALKGRTKGHMQTAEQCSAIGRLMSPQEVYAATLSRTDIPQEIKQEWFLCGDISENAWNAMSTGQVDIGFRVSAFTTPVNSAYACFTVQIDQSQVRFVLPLGSRKSQRFLQDVSQCGLHLSLGRNNGNVALVRKFDVEPMHLVPVLDLAKQCRELTGQSLIIDTALTVAELRNIESIPSTFHDVAVTDAHVIVVLPGRQGAEAG